MYFFVTISMGRIKRSVVLENNKFKIGQHFIKLLLLYILLLFVFLSLYVFSVLVSDYIGYSLFVVGNRVT